MVLPGETGHINTKCKDCKTTLGARVFMSMAGYYIGTICECGPYSRESGYYKTREEAETALKNNNFGR